MLWQFSWLKIQCLVFKILKHSQYFQPACAVYYTQFAPRNLRIYFHAPVDPRAQMVQFSFPPLVEISTSLAKKGKSSGKWTQAGSFLFLVQVLTSPIKVRDGFSLSCRVFLPQKIKQGISFLLIATSCNGYVLRCPCWPPMTEENQS